MASHLQLEKENYLSLNTTHKSLQMCTFAYFLSCIFFTPGSSNCRNSALVITSAILTLLQINIFIPIPTSSHHFQRANLLVLTESINTLLDSHVLPSIFHLWHQLPLQCYLYLNSYLIKKSLPL